jgi:hypothetical protein
MPVSRFARVGSVVMLLVSPLLMGQGCGFTVTLPDEDSGDGNPVGSPVAENTVLFRFVNASEMLGVDVEFFATGSAVTDFDAELFIDENQVTAVGLFGRGVVPGMDTDEVEVECSEALNVGTRGGEFLDADTGEVLGRGKQFIFTRDVNFICGDVITFEFFEREDEFTTEISIQ